MKKVLCFGELLLRYSPQINGGWIRHHNMPVYIGGAELNTATALAAWRVPVTYCTVLHHHDLAKDIISSLQQRGLETRHIQLAGERIGTYYLPQGADLKSGSVIYDRAYSAFWALKPRQINWDEAFEEVGWFHMSAICPALNKNVAAVCKEALQAAAQKNITCSIDLNYRSKLWQWGKDPVDVMPELVHYCEVIMGNIWAAQKMLGIELPAHLEADKKAYLAQAEKTSIAIIERFPKCNQVANTFRFDADAGIRYYATLYCNNLLHQSRELQTEIIVDKIGSGDTFMAGLIYGNLEKMPAQRVIDFAAAAAFHKLFIPGDASTASVTEIQNTFSSNV